MPKQFEFCKICRFNHNQGKGHKYSSKHQQQLAPLLAKAHQKFKDVSFFRKNPSWLREEDRSLNKFWCHFCEEEVSEENSVFVCSNTIRHLASSSHLRNIKKFWFEQGADVDKRHLYVIGGEELSKWEDACNTLSASALQEPSPEAVNNIHSECSSSKSTSCELVSVTAFANSDLNAVEPLPFYKYGDYSSTDEDIHRRNLGALRSQNCGTEIAGQGLGRQVKTHGLLVESMEHTGLTCIRQPSSGLMDGNVHSGAPPPWLQASHKKFCTESSIHQPLSQAQERRMRKLRNPNRVGAAWAEKRRAEIEMEIHGESQHRTPVGDKNWLPSFGRVWQGGTRRETRKEFEAEKRLEDNLGLTPPLEKPNMVQPYISKRQRLEDSTKPHIQGST